MMIPYSGPQHTSVAFSLNGSECHVIATGAKQTEAPAENLIFEIGSITKVFTAILLCVLFEEGKIDPFAPLADLSDDLSAVPRWITPISLTSHTSGLPRLHVPIWKALIKPLPDDPYAAFSRHDLLAWLQNWSANAPRKSRHVYSNLGVGLLGEAMAMKEGKAFPDLLADKVIRPLGLKETGGCLNQDQQRRFVQPRHAKGQAVLPWTFQAMAGAGFLRSTASDLARFSGQVIKAITAPETTLDRALSRSATSLVGLGRNGSSDHKAQCWGWFASTLDRNGPRILHHDGGTAGSACALYVCPEQAQALAVLSNKGVATHLWSATKLDWSSPLRQAHDYVTTR